MARASNPLKTRLRPQLSIETEHATSETNATAPRAVDGTIAMREIALAAGGEVATMYPVSTTMAICRVNSARSQKPPPNASATALGPEPLRSAASDTTTTPISAKT
jgi:hypothetical protein